MKKRIPAEVERMLGYWKAKDTTVFKDMMKIVKVYSSMEPEKQNTTAKYTVNRQDKNGKAKGNTHFSHDGKKTLCGLYCSEWNIVDSNYDGEVTCKTCKNLVNK